MAQASKTNAQTTQPAAQRPPVRKPAQTDPIPTGAAGAVKVTTDPSIAAAHAAAQAASAAARNKAQTGSIADLMGQALAQLAAAPESAPHPASGRRARPNVSGPAASPWFQTRPVLERATLRSAGESWTSIQPGRIAAAVNLSIPARPLPAQRPQEEATQRRGTATMDPASLQAWQERRLKAATALYGLHVTTAALLTSSQGLTVCDLAAVCAALQITDDRAAIMKELGRRLNTPLTIHPDGRITADRELMYVPTHQTFEAIGRQLIREHQQRATRPHVVAIKRQEWTAKRSQRQRQEAVSQTGASAAGTLATLLGAL